MKHILLTPLKLALTVTVLLVVFSFQSQAAEAERMTKEELKQIMDKDSVTILDVRTGRDWKSSQLKIKGAKRIAPDEFAAKAGKLPETETYVLYCA